MKFYIFILWMALSSFNYLVICLKKFRTRTRGCNIFDGNLSKEEKYTIVDIHNKYRNQIALQNNNVGPQLPYATNMLQMYWDEELATKAQQWADKCRFKHSTYAYRKQPSYPVGENMYEAGVSEGFIKMDWNKAISTWFEEIRSFSGIGKQVERMEIGNPVTGHFSQVIWANSYLIGCGFAQYPDGGFYTNLYICHYGPHGNVVGEPLYKSSKTQGCECPGQLNCHNETYKGLCCVEGICTKESLYYNGPEIDGTVPADIHEYTS
jgi:hypothetical protein